LGYFQIRLVQIRLGKKTFILYQGSILVVPPSNQNGQGFRVCVRTMLSQFSPVGTAESIRKYAGFLSPTRRKIVILSGALHRFIT
jgi:hypothetical protein